MYTELCLTALIATSISGGSLSSQQMDTISASSPPSEMVLAEQVANPPVVEETPAPEVAESMMRVAEVEMDVPEDTPDVEEEFLVAANTNEVVEEETEEVVEIAEVDIPEPVEMTVTAVAPAEVPVETSEEDGLTYDMITQRDVADEAEPVPPEIAQGWYVEETANLGLETLFVTYLIEGYDFFIVTTPSNFVYQYDFYAYSPDGGHVNLVGVYQYDATGARTYHFNQVTGVWE